MINREILKKQIIYRSTHRGTKEMDMLLGKFVEENINSLREDDLINLNQILNLEDETLYNWYFNGKNENIIPNNKISIMLKNFKF